MANTTTPRGSIYNGWFYDAVTPTLKYYNRGTLVFTCASAGITTADTLATTGAATLASATTTGNHTFSLTVTAGDVGTNGEQLTSAGTGANTWETA